MAGILQNMFSYLTGAEEEVQSDQQKLDLLRSACGYLAKYDGRNECWTPLPGMDDILLALGNTDQVFTTTFAILRGDSPILTHELSEELQLRFEEHSHSLNWLEFQDDEVQVLQFVFQDEQEEDAMKKLIAIKLIERTHRKDFSKLVKEEDEEWIASTYDQGEEMDYEQSEEWGEQGDPADPSSPSGFDEDDPLAEEERGGWSKAARNARPLVPQNETNQHIDDSLCWNRTYVIRNNDRGADLGLFKHSDRSDLSYIGKVKIQDTDGRDFTPTKMQTHRQDNQLLFLTKEDPNAISIMDMERGEIVESWKPKDFGVLKDIAPLTKYEQKTDNQLLKVVSKNGYATIDPRTSKKLVEEYKMKTNPKFTSMATTGHGQWAIGSEDGSIRLYNKTMRAKTLLPGLGHKVKNIEVTNDGNWILVTCATYLLLIPTKMPDSEKLGFDTRMGKKKPKPFKLRLKAADMQRFGIRHVDFTSAKFDVGENDEKWIVTSTGRYIVKWNFARAKQGVLSDYLIQEVGGKITGGVFRYNKPDSLTVAEEHNVYTKKSHRR